MKLWIDDIRNAPDESWTVARTVTSAIKAIAQFQFDEISLDHDISHQVVVGSLSRPYPCEETFQAVAYYIATKYCHDFPIGGGLNVARLNIYPKITIHSANLVGADEILNILKDYGIEAELKPMRAANRLESEV